VIIIFFWIFVNIIKITRTISIIAATRALSFVTELRNLQRRPFALIFGSPMRTVGEVEVVFGSLDPHARVAVLAPGQLFAICLGLGEQPRGLINDRFKRKVLVLMHLVDFCLFFCFLGVVLLEAVEDSIFEVGFVLQNVEQFPAGLAYLRFVAE
jgi:hypothetical protein